MIDKGRWSHQIIEEDLEEEEEAMVRKAGRVKSVLEIDGGVHSGTGDHRGGCGGQMGRYPPVRGRSPGLVRDRQSPGSRRVEVSTGRGEKRAGSQGRRGDMRCRESSFRGQVEERARLHDGRARAINYEKRQYVGRSGGDKSVKKNRDNIFFFALLSPLPLPTYRLFS